MRRFQLTKKSFKQWFCLLGMFILWKMLLLCIRTLAGLLLAEMPSFSLRINPPKTQLPTVCSWVTILCCRPLSDIIAIYYLQSQMYSIGKSAVSCKTMLFSTILNLKPKERWHVAQFLGNMWVLFTTVMIS